MTGKKISESNGIFNMQQELMQFEKRLTYLGGINDVETPNEQVGLQKTVQ